MSNEPGNRDDHTHRDEMQAFVMLAVIVIPLLTVILIASYGFIVWITQILTGPPGHG